jgi:hypothetical protein
MCKPSLTIAGVFQKTIEKKYDLGEEKVYFLREMG